jgi:hypothetical protein
LPVPAAPDPAALREAYNRHALPRRALARPKPRRPDNRGYERPTRQVARWHQWLFQAREPSPTASAGASRIVELERSWDSFAPGRSANGHVTSRSTLERLRQRDRFQRRSQALPYHSSFRPNWICRDVVDVDVITPAVGDGVAEADPNTTAFGDPKLARLNTLKNSARN